ncbi:hypothetical protein MRB53_035590 [Persea americana]|uniref:Uncharacterized protein n=1 Tax=Persea americana TaxID=3435 RepID=A0ACC2K5D3_PERAE|nr:hypothetical protein MRB53_035590 [Persea americana]
MKTTANSKQQQQSDANLMYSETKKQPRRPPGWCLDELVITEFCKSIGADGKQRQGLIRLAKKNGEWIGFLA